jgi:hypothetical protein
MIGEFLLGAIREHSGGIAQKKKYHNGIYILA